MNSDINLTTAEEKLAELVWQKAPLTSPELVELANKAMDWKKSTTYTILKKLCDKGVLKNDNALVTVVLTHDELLAQQSRHYVESTFGGSLPRFIASFVGGGKKLTAEQTAELKQLINELEGDQPNG